MTFRENLAGKRFSGLFVLILLILALGLSACGATIPTATVALASNAEPPRLPLNSTGAAPVSPAASLNAPTVTNNLYSLNGIITTPGNPMAAITIVNTTDGKTALLTWNAATRVVTAAGTDATLATLEKGMTIEVRGNLVSEAGTQISVVPVQIKITDFGPDYGNAVQDDSHCQTNIKAYFAALDEKQYAKAYTLLAYSSQKQEHNATEFGQKQWQMLQSAKELKILEGPSFDSDNKPSYKITVKIEPGDQPGNWQAGENVRWVSLIKENGTWHLARIATSPPK